MEQLVAEARALKERWGFTSHKLKGGVFPPEYELECYRALAHALPGDGFRSAEASMPVTTPLPSLTIGNKASRTENVSPTFASDTSGI